MRKMFLRGKVSFVVLFVFHVEFFKKKIENFDAKIFERIFVV
jgi:hypothetical protein